MKFTKAELETVERWARPFLERLRATRTAEEFRMVLDEERATQERGESHLNEQRLRFSISSDELSTLLCLMNSWPVRLTAVQIADRKLLPNGPKDRDTIGKCLKLLESCGLATRPRGTADGWQITYKGAEMVKCILPAHSPHDSRT